MAKPHNKVLTGKEAGRDTQSARLFIHDSQEYAHRGEKIMILPCGAMLTAKKIPCGFNFQIAGTPSQVGMRIYESKDERGRTISLTVSGYLSRKSIQPLIEALQELQAANEEI